MRCSKVGQGEGIGRTGRTGFTRIRPVEIRLQRHEISDGYAAVIIYIPLLPGCGSNLIEMRREDVEVSDRHPTVEIQITDSRGANHDVVAELADADAAGIVQIRIDDSIGPGRPGIDDRVVERGLGYVQIGGIY